MPWRSFHLCLLVILLNLGASAQAPDPGKVDRYVSAMSGPIKGLRELDSILIEGDKIFAHPEEKIRFVFSWVAKNLEYDCREEGGTQAGSSLEDILKNGRSTCSGYSGMMNYSLKKMGFESVTIRGLAKTARRDLLWEKLPRPNHSWNAVKLNNEWKLLDATWASGEASENCDTVIRSFSPFYFFPEPELLALSHFPTDPNWQLLSNPVDSAIFLSRPVFHDPFYEKNISSFSPETGVLRVKRNGQIRFLFNSSGPLEKIAIWCEERKTITPEFGRFSKTSGGYEFIYRVKALGDYYLDVAIDGNRTAIVYRVIVD